MGVTPTSGLAMPRKKPVTPCLARISRTTSSMPLYWPGCAVCIRTLTMSNGWPTRTQHTPPKPPERNDLMPEVCGVSLAAESIRTSAFFELAAASTPSMAGLSAGGISACDRRILPDMATEGSVSLRVMRRDSR